MDLNYLIKIFPLLLKGSIKTLELTIISVGFGTLIGIFIALIKIQNNKILYFIGYLYTWLFRGTPLLLQIIFIYFGVPSLSNNSIILTPTQGALIALSLNSGAYMAEIIRGGILAVDKGQFEASKALGFTYLQTMRKVILPQTFKMILPAFSNEFITLLKDTSLVSTIAMVEIMRTAQVMYAASWSAEPYIGAAIVYLILTSVFTTMFGKFEKMAAKY
ncbi:MAG: amino acid ABC transporter permease [Clostridiaceae bacterium]